MTEWIGPGTWLTDNRGGRHQIGVITDVNERDRDFAARLSIRWRPDMSENCSVLFAIHRLKHGAWEVDHGE